MINKHLFNIGRFFLHSGHESNFKIDCDALSDEDWTSLARIIYERLSPFRKVIGIPEGGLNLAKALKPYCLPNPEYPTLIVDDVLTTGNSMDSMRNSLNDNVKGCVVFARGKCPEWITPIFSTTRWEGK